MLESFLPAVYTTLIHSFKLFGRNNINFDYFLRANISKYEKSTFARFGIKDCLITTCLRPNFQLYQILLFIVLYFPLLSNNHKNHKYKTLAFLF